MYVRSSLNRCYQVATLLIRDEVNLLKMSSETGSKLFKIIYNGEFDPGSGLTLAAGLTHASRGAALVLVLDGDRRTGA